MQTHEQRRTHGLRRWFRIHQYTSLICTAFMLVLCITGLPLVFRDEIEQAVDTSVEVSNLPDSTSRVDLDRLVVTARRAYPEQVPTGIFIDPQAPQIRVYMAPSQAIAVAEPQRVHWLKFDARTGQLLGESQPALHKLPSVMRLMFALHSSLLTGLPGTFLLGVMGLLFVVAILSGIVLYRPYMQQLSFGTVRRHKGVRLRWLDLHNLLGITTLAWTLVVGVTGAMNVLATPLFALWEQTEVQAAMAPWYKQAPTPTEAWAPLQSGLDKVRAALPGMVVTGINFPGSQYGTPHHYVLWARGNSPITSQLLSPALVDANTGELTAVVHMPWYLRALEISRPLHFGDYGGLPLKIIWAMLDLLTIILLGSGLYLWWARRKTRAMRVDKLAHPLTDPTASHAHTSINI